jgi:hypothetical protein
MLDQRIPSQDLDVAAAFVTLGVQAKLEPHVDHKSGREVCVWYLSTSSSILPAFSTARVMAALKNTEERKNLENIDGVHPILYALSGIKNWHALRSGRPVILVKCGKWGRARYILSEMVTPMMRPVLPPACAGKPYVNTCASDCDPLLDEAAAAGTCGLPYHRGTIHPSQHPFEPTTIEELRALPPDGEYGYLYALKAIGNRRRMKDYADRAPRLVHFQSPYNERSGYVVDHISGAGMDKMRRFFHGGRP